MAVAETTVNLYETIVIQPFISRLPDRLWRRYVELRLMAFAWSGGRALPGPAEISYLLGIPHNALLIDLEGLRAEGLLIDEPDRFEIAVPVAAPADF